LALASPKEGRAIRTRQKMRQEVTHIFPNDAWLLPLTTALVKATTTLEEF
jgi:hypothetical protein